MQRLKTDDRLAFAFGCFDPEPPPDGTYYADRFCPNGNFDLYDYRSENEQRRNGVLDLSLHGRVRDRPAGPRPGGRRLAEPGAPPVRGAGVQLRRHRQRRRHGDDAAGPDTDDAEHEPRRALDRALPARPDRASARAPPLWLGARHTRLQRSTDSTDGLSRTDYSQSFTTPFAAASYAFTPGQIVYASWGRGVESDVAPDLPTLHQPPARRFPPRRAGRWRSASRAAASGSSGAWRRSTSSKPRFDDVGTCVAGDGDPPDCTRTLAGAQRHRGVEAGGAWRQGGLELRGGAQWLQARLEDTPNPALDGKRPTNVPGPDAPAAGALCASRPCPGWRVQGGGSYESAREVLPDNSIEIPSVTRFDLGFDLRRRLAGAAWTLRAGVDNVFDRRAWRESPYQFSHVYLFPLAPRTWRMSLQADL